MATTPVDLYAFGNRAGPRAPRLGRDIFPDAAGMVGPEDPARARGASTVADLATTLLTGHYHRLPAGTVLPGGLGVVADGRDVKPRSRHGPSHHTMYPTIAMPVKKFIELLKSLPWQYGGRK
jgi:hypothetical protein